MVNFYEILGLLPDASDEEIRRAYHRLAREYHPDLHPGTAAASDQILKQINEAYSVLSDPEERRVYDLVFGAHFQRNPPSPVGRSPEVAVIQSVLYVFSFVFAALPGLFLFDMNFSWHSVSNPLWGTWLLAAIAGIVGKSLSAQLDVSETEGALFGTAAGLIGGLFLLRPQAEYLVLHLTLLKVGVSSIVAGFAVGSLLARLSSARVSLVASLLGGAFLGFLLGHLVGASEDISAELGRLGLSQADAFYTWIVQSTTMGGGLGAVLLTLTDLATSRSALAPARSRRR